MSKAPHLDFGDANEFSIQLLQQVTIMTACRDESGLLLSFNT